MKKIFYKTGLIAAILVIAANVVYAQLPLQQGDAVITHSPNGGWNMVPGAVVRVVHTSNTSTAPLGQSWNSTSGMFPTSTPPGTKQPNDFYTNWKFGTLGHVFGITLDANPSPNIYVSSSQIYDSNTSHERKIWRLDGTTGANFAIYNFNNSLKSLGNLKYASIGGVENIYVSDWGSGVIQRLTGNSATATAWNLQADFNPKFGLAQDNAAEMAYGLAIRNMPGGGYRLYYAKVSTNSNSSGFGGFGGNQIWSVGLNPANGDFLGPEVQENIPTSMNSSPITNQGSLVLPVIADIAFTRDGKQMLVGQQTWKSFGAIAPHNSKVWEFKIDNANVWQLSGDIFPAGQSAGKNAVGGVSYSNNIIKGNASALACDTTAWFTADAIRYNVGGAAPLIYGLQGMNANGGAPAPYTGSYPGSIWIDADEDFVIQDKNYLGDVEVYKKPLECTPCGCGSWQTTPSLNGDLIPAVPVIFHVNTDGMRAKSLPPGGPINTGPIGPVPLLVNYPVQFVQNNVSGLINATYACTGGCSTDMYTWSITSSTNAVIASGTTLPVDLAQYNSALQCGKYNLTIKAKCGDKNCGSLSVPITIICEPPSCCKAKIDVDLSQSTVQVATNPDSREYSTANFTYNLNYDMPMSEVRVSVEEFRLVANSPACLSCNNRPVTWGNILAARLNGEAMTLSGLPGPATGSLEADYREAVYNTGMPLLPSAAGLNIQLSLPAVSDLSCCEVYAYVCIKFTFKDTECRECVRMVCGKIKLVAPKVTDTHGGPKNEKIETKKFDVRH